MGSLEHLRKNFSGHLLSRDIVDADVVVRELFSSRKRREVTGCRRKNDRLKFLFRRSLNQSQAQDYLFLGLRVEH